MRTKRLYLCNFFINQTAIYKKSNEQETVSVTHDEGGGSERAADHLRKYQEHVRSGLGQQRLDGTVAEASIIKVKKKSNNQTQQKQKEK